MKGSNSIAGVRPSIKGPVLVALLLLVLALPHPALAKAALTSSNPAQGSVAPSGLATITLTFSEPVSVDLTSARLTALVTGKQAPITSQVDPTDHKKLTIKTDPLPDGGYTVNWHAVSETDNTPTDGHITFSVGVASTQAGSTGTSSQASSGGSSAPGNAEDAEENENEPSGPWITVLVALVVILSLGLVGQTLWYRNRGRAK